MSRRNSFHVVFSDFVLVPAQCHGASECSLQSCVQCYARDSTVRPEFGGNPNRDSLLPCERQDSKARLMSVGVPEFAMRPSYLLAINLRCHANNVSGVTT